MAEGGRIEPGGHRPRPVAAVSPPAAAAVLAGDPAVAGQAADFAAAALAYCARPGVFGGFRRALLDAEPDTGWVVQVEPGWLATFAELIAGGAR